MTTVGIQVRTSNALEMQPESARIGTLWQDAYASNLFGSIPNRIEDKMPVAVYTAYDSDHHGAYSIQVGAAVSAIDTIADGMSALSIPASRYLAFKATGSMPQAVIDVWGVIWSYFGQPSPYKRVYTYDIEQYTGTDTVTVYIAIADEAR